MLKTGALICIRPLVSSCIKPPVLNAIKHECLVSLKVQPVRSTSFFNRLTQQELWKGTTSVSNAGRRKGRGKGINRKGKRNLNRGQKIGHGKIRVQWPALNTGLFDKGNRLVEIKKLKSQTPTETTTPNILVKKRTKVHPLDRAWTGSTVKGRRIGPPDPVDNETFEDFQSIILDSKIAVVQTALVGKKRRFYSLIGIGNGAGVFGFGIAKTIDFKTSLRLAKNRAVKKLLTIDLIEKHTVNHDFFSEYGRTKVFVYKRSEGFGLVCHRIIKAICELIGIENLYAKVEGPCNPRHIIRAFVTGLLRQKTYQEIANEKKLHLVEYREDCLNFPRILASPNECLTLEEVNKKPVLFEEYIMGDRLVYDRGNKVPFFMKTASWRVYLKRTTYKRNHEKVRLDLLAKYGHLRSFLTDIYPECRSPDFSAKEKKKNKGS